MTPHAALATRDALAEALGGHSRGGVERPNALDSTLTDYASSCSCGWNAFDGGGTFLAHLADALLASGAVTTPQAFVAALAEDEAVVERVRVELQRLTEGSDRQGTEKWPAPDRAIYSLAIEEAGHAALRALAAALTPDAPTPTTEETSICGCGHGRDYHGPEVPGCVECRCRQFAPTQPPSGDHP